MQAIYSDSVSEAIKEIDEKIMASFNRMKEKHKTPREVFLALQTDRFHQELIKHKVEYLSKQTPIMFQTDTPK